MMFKPTPSTSVPGLIIAAPASSSGKTTISLALLRYLRNQGYAVSSAKIGPDYIDPCFHTIASGRTCYNLDTWAMRTQSWQTLIEQISQHSELIVIEGVMGLFDGAPDGSASAADLSARTGWPIVLVVDAQGMAASAAALVHGFASFRSDVPVAGIIFNRVGSAGHGQILRQACAELMIPVLACIPRSASLNLPDRHLGLVQAREHPDLENFLEQAATHMAEHLDLSALLAIAKTPKLVSNTTKSTAFLPPLGQRIALAHDDAFAFIYPFLLAAWQAAGAEIIPFAPLNNETPDGHADAVYLPGGYPELYAAQLAANTRFLNGLRNAAQQQVLIYGECGGYMVLGDQLIDYDGNAHAMAGLLAHTTSFAERQLHLGYRQVQALPNTPFFASQTFRAHEFHFSTMATQNEAQRLFSAHDARFQDLGQIGSQRGSVMGSYIHLIDRFDCA